MKTKMKIEKEVSFDCSEMVPFDSMKGKLSFDYHLIQ